MIQEQSLSEIEAVEKIEKIYNEFNRIMQKDLCKITRNNGRYHLVKENDDLEPIGNGGFAKYPVPKNEIMNEYIPEPRRIETSRSMEKYFYNSDGILVRKESYNVEEKEKCGKTADTMGVFYQDALS